jgi:NHLM bacteriocin system ABC transporter peptidase/ATP-binding protein
MARSVPEPRAAKSRPPHRVSTPTVLQIEAAESGAAALGIVLGSFGRFVTLEELRIECGVSRDGSKPENIARAARKYGLNATILNREPQALPELAFPAILFWQFNHFLVLEGFAKREVYLNDPAMGARVVSEAELDASFTGLVLVFERTADFKPGGSRARLIPALRQRLAGSERSLLFAIVAGLALVVPSLVIPTLTSVFVDEVLVARMDGWLKPLLIGLAITAAFRAALTWLLESCLLRLETKSAISGSSRYVAHVLRLPLAFFAQRWPGEVGARVQLNDDVADVLSAKTAGTCISLLTIVFFAAAMAAYDLVLTAATIALSAINVVALRWVSESRSDSSERAVRASGQVDGASMGGLQMIENLKATGTEDEFFTDWAGRHAKWLNAENELSVYTVYIMALPPLLSTLSTVALLLIGGIRVMNGVLTIGMLVAFQSLADSFMEPVNELMEMGGTLQEAKGDLARLEDVLRYPADPNVPELTAVDPSPPTMVRLKGHVELRNVTFGYGKLDPPLIREFNLVIEPGARVALVGGSGSGKSTIARLVCGLYEPWEGEILFDGYPRAAIARTVQSNSIGVVDQDIFLFGGRIRDNLTLWDATIPEASLTRAAKDACIHPDIIRRADGYDSHLEEGGNNFSGGQRQRLEIARALVDNPSLLVLDEATSALDAFTEKQIDEHIRRRGCSCLIVAHRLSTIRDADEILVLEGGRVVQRGTHDELMAMSGAYERLIES